MTWNTTATDWELLEKLNNDEVIRQIPLMVYLFLISLAGIPGNGLVCYIYKSQYSMSSSRWFIFFLGAVDIILCVVILPCELATLFQQYTFTNRIWCKFSAFFNLLMLISLGLTLLVVSIDRYRKVCKPLGWQINFKIARILCAACCTFSVVISLPVFAVYDIYEFKIENLTVKASECSFRKSLEQSAIAFYYVAFGMTVFVGALLTICILYCIIGRNIREHLRKDKIKRHISLTASMARKTDHIRPINASDKARVVRFGEPTTSSSLPSVHKKSLVFCTKLVNTHKSASSNDIKGTSNPPIHLSQSSAASVDSLNSPLERSDVNEVTEDSQSNTLVYEDEEFKKPSVPLTRVQKTKSKRIRRARARKATFSMCLISIAFVVSYLPFLSLLLLRTIQKDVDASMSDTWRAVYKFFLRSGYLNCAINPFIYGISDSSFRRNCKSVLRSMYGRCLHGTRFSFN